MWRTQGSIQGQLLFLLYINDLPHCLNKTKPQLIADDKNLIAPSSPLTELAAAVNSDLENLSKWLIANKLSLNVAKTKYMLIRPKPVTKNIADSHPNIFIENKQIKQVHKCKTLGVTIDQQLSWKNNTEEVCKKSTAGISANRTIKPFVGQDTPVHFNIQRYCLSVL